MTVQETDVVVVGGGAAGLMAAGTAASRGLRVVLLERNRQLGRKVRITGKGRCNLTKACLLYTSPDVRRRLQAGEPLVLENKTTGETLTLASQFTARQTAMLLAGGLLDYTREQSARSDA